MIRKFLKAGALSALLLLSACGVKTEYTNALPKDASMVVAVEVDDVALKAGLNGKEGERVSKKLKSLLKNGLQGEAARLAERMVDRPSEAGLSFDDKVYLFLTPHSEAMAVLVKVDDEGKVEALLEALVKENIATPLREESGCRWTQVGQLLCAFNDGTFLLMQPSKGDAMRMKTTLLSLMRQQEGEGFPALPEFAKVQAEGNDIASVVNLNAVSRNYTTALRMGLSADIRLEDIKYFVTANFGQGSVKIHAESLIANPKVEAFFDRMEQILHPVEGRYLDCFQGNTMLWTGANVRGKELYDMLRRNPSIRQQLDNPPLPVDVASIFAAIDGDVAIGVSSMQKGEFMLYADVTDSRFLQTFEDLRPLLALTGGQISLYDTGKDEYMMRTYYGDFWFGVKKNTLYVTNVRAMAEEAGRTYGASMAVKPWSGEVKKNCLFVSANMKDYKQLFLHLMETLNVAIPDGKEADAEIILKDKQANLLKRLVDTLVEM
jgi:hypothetical protein